MSVSAVARGPMPLADHLNEARRRSVRAAAALLVGIVVGFFAADTILDALRAPIEQIARDRDASLNYDTVTGAFDVKVRIAILTGIVISSPVWLHQLAAFTLPGLTRQERRYVLGFAAAALPLFGVGCAFGFWLFPHMVQVLTGLSSNEDSTILTATAYVDFVLKVVVATGVAFVLPVIVVLLNLLGVVSARALRGSWRGIVVLITLFSALVTPAADVMSMFFVAVPMAALFGVALVIAEIHDRRVSRRAAALLRVHDDEEAKELSCSV